MLPIAVASAMCYALPVLLMTSDIVQSPPDGPDQTFSETGAPTKSVGSALGLSIFH